MTISRSLSIFLAAALMYVAVLLLMAFVSAAKPSAQAFSQRLQLHAEKALNADRDGWFELKIQAVCDTGNGTMLYITREASNTQSLSVTMLPNGCQKAQAER